MFELLKKRIKNEKGLSLVELLAVIVILAIVAAIAIPAIGNIIDNSRIKGAKSDVANVISAANIYFTENSEKENVTKAELKPFIDSEGVLKDATYTVTKATATTATSLSTTAAVKVGNRNVTITSATIDGINVNSPDPTTDDQFKFTK